MYIAYISYFLLLSYVLAKKTFGLEFNFLVSLFLNLVPIVLILAITLANRKDMIKGLFSRLWRFLDSLAVIISPTERTKSALIKNLALISSLIIFSYILATNLLRNIRSIEPFIDYTVFDLTYLRLSILIGFVLGLIGSAYTSSLEKLKFKPPRNREVNIAHILISFLFATFYNGVFSSLGFLRYPIFIFLLIIFYRYFPKLISSYISINPRELKTFFKKITLPKPTPFMVFSLFVIFFSLLSIIKVALGYVQGKPYHRSLQRRGFYITKILPQNTMHGERVAIIGNNFGWKINNDDRYRLMTTDGEIEIVDLWTNEQLEFTIQLDMPQGKKQLWIEKPLEDRNNLHRRRSNTVTLNIYPRQLFNPQIEDSNQMRAIKRIKKFLFLNFEFFNNIIPRIL